MTLQHLRSSTANKRPDPTAMADGQIALNTAAASPGLFYKDSAGNLVKAGPVHVGSTAPNVSPASGGTAGNSTGESWLDTSGSNPLLKIWSGAAWQTVQPVASGTVVSTADTGSVTSTMIADGTIVNADVNASAAIAGTKISPDFGSQNVTTTGTVTGASLNPTSSTVPTNGVYLPAANSVAISTNGTQRLYIDATGNLGVSTTTKAWESGQFFAVQFGSGGAVYGRASGDQDRNGFVSNCYHSSAGWRYIASSAHANRYDQNDGNHIWYYAGTGTADASVTFSEAMRIDTSGRLGVGTSSVSSNLHIKPANGDDSAFTNGLRVERHDTSGQYALFSYTGGAASITAVETTASNPVVRFLRSTNGSTTTESLRIDASGRVGIGTSSITGFSDYTTVQLGSSSSGSALRLVASGDTPGTDDFVIYKNTSGSYLRSYGDPIIFHGSSAEYARFDTSGRLGIGTTTVDQKLHLRESGATSVYLRIDNNSSAATGFIGFPADGSYLNFETNQAIRWTSGSGYSERMRLDTSGRLLVGTSSDSQSSTLVLQGTSASTTDPAVLRLCRGVSNPASGTDLGYVVFGDSGHSTAASIIAQRDGGTWTSGSSQPTLLKFSTTADGASSPTERMRINNAGATSVFGANGVLFARSGATSGSNELIFGGYYSASSTTTGTISVQITADGSIKNLNNSYGQLTSDERFKQDIVDASSQWDDIKNIRITNYRWKSDPTGPMLLGPIAQELQAVSPGLVDKRIAEKDDEAASGGLVSEGDEVLSFKASILYMKAVKALQEAMERIETLEASNTDLLARVSALESA